MFIDTDLSFIHSALTASPDRDFVFPPRPIGGIIGNATADKDHPWRDRAHDNHCRRGGYFYWLHKARPFDIE
jgi:hypothetical protein